MRIEITVRPSDNLYFWKIWDGPDGIEYCEGVGSNLEECVEKITQFRLDLATYYTD